MQAGVPDKLLIVAGRGTYPFSMVEGARKAGVRRILVLALRGMASRRLACLVDEIYWCGIGELDDFMRIAQQSGARHVVGTGQLSPTALFRTRFDATARALLRALPAKNAHTIYGRMCDMLTDRGLTVIPASMFMDDRLPQPGVLTRRAPDEREANDIALGHRIAMASSNLDIGQTVVVKDGMILAVEAFEGTNRTIRRGGKLGGRGAVVVKVAKDGHDMRFDIPAIGRQTISVLRRARVSALAFQARRTVLLERDEAIAAADRLGMAIVALDSGLPPAPTRL